MDTPPRHRDTDHTSCPHCRERHPTRYAHCPRTGRRLVSSRSLVGKTIADRYRVLELLGEGGMGVVYAAEHTMLGRKVAIKHLHPELATDHRSVLRFQQEARAAAAIGHEHIVEVIDLGFADDGAPFLVMEHLRGETLGSVLRREGRLPLDRVRNIALQTLDALASVHEHGIVHRDLKPDNIFLTTRGGTSDYVKILDFGVSKIARDDTTGLELTHTGAVLGTPYYMSPEQARGMRNLDGRVDLYAVGVILYQALSGRLPFEAENYHALLQAILGTMPPPLTSLVPGLSVSMQAVVERAIAREREDRFRDAGEMALALRSESSGRFEIRPPLPDATAESPIHTGHVTRAAVEPFVTSPPPARATPFPPSILEPLPRFYGGGPRHFYARSSNWSDPDAGGGEKTSSYATSALTPPRTPISSRPLFLSNAATWSPRVRGAMLRAVHVWVERRAGRAGVASFLSKLGATHRAAVDGVLLPSAWFPLDLFHRHLDTLIASQLGDFDEIATELGTLLAEAHAEHLSVSISDAVAQPWEIIDRFPAFWRAFHGSGFCQVPAPSDERKARVEILHLKPDHAMHAAMMGGFFASVLTAARVKEARSTLGSSIARGDDSTTVELSWD